MKDEDKRDFSEMVKLANYQYLTGNITKKLLTEIIDAQAVDKPKKKHKKKSFGFLPDAVSTMKLPEQEDWDG